MALTYEIIKLALLGVDILRYKELRASGYRFLENHKEAISEVMNNLDDFEHQIDLRFVERPLTKKYFERLVRIRLNQENPLHSRIIAELFTGFSTLEDRLRRIDGAVKNVEYITEENSPPHRSDAGEETDEIILDMWAELLAIDLLINQLHLREVEKIVVSRGQPSVDFRAIYENSLCVLEVTRIRKRDFNGGTAPTVLDDCSDEINLKSIQFSLHSKLKKKDNQVRRFCEQSSDEFERRVVVLKTSQWEYQDCSETVMEQVQSLAQTRNYGHITDIIFIPDIETLLWCKELKSS